MLSRTFLGSGVVTVFIQVQKQVLVFELGAIFLQVFLLGFLVLVYLLPLFEVDERKFAVEYILFFLRKHIQLLVFSLNSVKRGLVLLKTPEVINHFVFGLCGHGQLLAKLVTNIF